MAEDIYRHTIEIIQRAEALDEYRALPESDMFDVEYWDLEQAKLRKGTSAPPLQGEIALVTGVASGIGRATVDAMREAGAAVAALDISESVSDVFDAPEVLPICCDVTDSRAVEDALRHTVLAFGGLDMLVLNAGVFPGGTPIAELSSEEWERVLRVNLDANLALMRAAHPLLRLSPRGGRVVVMGSKNVPAPGPGAAAYSASKAALTQLARVAALEWGKDGIRVNVLHPNAVFDTGIWTPEVLEERARHHGMTVEEYRRNNLLGVEVTSRDVAALAVALCTPLFAKTTGAQIPIDGGNERVI
jgi:NAD(P)-dependent dehydrogenase (short-subunit alcohol dehydrogenase family)